MVSPALTVELLASLLMSMAGPCTFFFNDAATTEIYAVSLHDAFADPWFAVAEVVPLVRWIVTLPGARSPMVQVNTPREMGGQQPAALPPFTDHDVPALVGTVSVTTVPWAMPGPAFGTVIV